MPHLTTLDPARRAIGLKARRKSKFHIKALIVILLLPVCVNAEPSSFTQSLMNESANMLDIGMERLRALTTRAENQKFGMNWRVNGKYGTFNASINSNYYPDDDKIYVSFSVSQSGLSEPQMASGCKIMMAYMRTWVIKSSVSLFGHIGEVYTNTTEARHKALLELIEFKCTFSSKKSSSETLFRASWPLADAEMTIDPLKLTN